MDVTNRKWWIKRGDKVEGPLDEEAFQARLRLGKISLKSEIKSDSMDAWQPLLDIVASDETFRRPSVMPPPSPENEDD